MDAFENVLLATEVTIEPFNKIPTCHIAGNEVLFGTRPGLAESRDILRSKNVTTKSRKGAKNGL